MASSRGQSGLRATGSGGQNSHGGLIEALQALTDKLEEAPSSAQMIEYGRYWSKVYRDRIGSWSAALKQAFDYSDDENATGPV